MVYPLEKRGGPAKGILLYRGLFQRENPSPSCSHETTAVLLAWLAVLILVNLAGGLELMPWMLDTLEPV